MRARPSRIRTLCLMLALTQSILVAQPSHPSVPWTLDHLNLEGYYKHVLLNGGPGVGVPPTSHFDALGLTYELVDTRNCESHRYVYRNLFIGSAMDKNGMLLYPDGTNRFALMVVGGAAAEKNIDDDCGNLPSQDDWKGGGGDFAQFLEWNFNPLNQSGQTIFNRFLEGGGAYSGFCAGSSIMCKNSLGITTYNDYGVDDATWRFNRTGDQLAAYLGNQTEINGINTVGGGMLPTFQGVPGGADILFEGSSFTEEGRYQFGPMVWSWTKANTEGYGRMVVSGAHPEQAASGFGLTAAMYSYALDGGGGVKIKSDALQNGETRTMDRDTEQNQPEYTKIGDKQIHHFTFQVNDSRDRFLLLELAGARHQVDGEVYDFRLYLNKNRPAFPSDHRYMGQGSLSDKTIYVENLSTLPGGTWHVGVELFTTVELETDLWGEVRYRGATEVLNGIAYELTATWSDQPLQVCEQSISNLAVAATLSQNTDTTITWDSQCLDNSARVTVDLLTATGAEVRTLATDVSAVNGRFIWNANQTPGNYRLRVRADHDAAVQAISAVFTIQGPTIRVIGKGSMVRDTLYFDGCKPNVACKSTLILSNTRPEFSLVGATVVDAAGNPSKVFRMSSPEQSQPFVMPFPAQLYLSLGGNQSATLNLYYNGGANAGAYYLELQSTKGRLEYQRIFLCVNCR